MRKFPALIGASIVTAGFLVFSSPSIALAHVLRQNNGISAELHIPPDDHPTANSPTQLELAFGDEQNAFSLPDCNCQIQIKQNNKLLQSLEPQPALEGATLDATVTARFPAAGLYDVVVSGQPKDHAFSAFQLGYPVRVADSPASVPVVAKKSRPAEVVIAACVVAIIGLLAYAASQNRRQSR